MSTKGKNRGIQGVAHYPNRDVNAANRAALAMGLRASKMTYAEIADAVGYASPSACRRAILRELDRTVIAEKAEHLRTQELAMLDQIHQKVWFMLVDQDNPRDDEMKLAAVDRLIALSNRRSKLMGLDKRPEELEGPKVVVRLAPPGYLGEVEPK